MAELVLSSAFEQVLHKMSHLFVIMLQNGYLKITKLSS